MANTDDNQLKNNQSQQPLNTLNGQQGVEEEYDDILSDFDVSTLLVVAQKSILIVSFLIISSFMAAFIYARYTKPVYESSSIIKLELSNQASALGITHSGGDAAQFEKISLISGEIELLKSHMIYEEVIKYIDLSVNYVVYGKVITEEKYTASPIHLKYKIKNHSWYNRKFDLDIHDQKEFLLKYIDLKGVQVSRLCEFNKMISLEEGDELTFSTTNHFMDEYLDSKMYVIINSPDAIISYLMANTKVEMMSLEAQTINISFRDNNSFKAADIVNVIDSAYLSLAIKNKSKTSEQTIEFLKQSLKKTEQQLGDAESKMEAFLRDNKTIDVKENYSKISAKIDELDEKRIEIRNQLDLLGQLKDIVQRDGDVKSIIPSISMLDDQEIASLLKEYNKSIIEREAMISTQNESTYAIKLKDKSNRILKENIVELIDLNRKIYVDALNTLNKDMLSLEAGVLGIPERETEYNRLKRYYDLYEKFYLLLMEKEVEYAIAKAGTIPNFTILSPAFPPVTPVYPKKGLLYSIGISIGLLLSIVLILIRYFLHDTISNQKELEKAIKAPVVGGIPEYQKEKMEFSRLIVDKSPKSIISESIRSIRTNLEFILASRSKKKIISVTSTVSGEGKTFVSTNLAGVIALSDLKVVLLDLDMRKPKVHLAFDKENIKGMSTILIGKHTWKECVYNTTIDNLHFISAGPTPPNPSELILRAEFDQLLVDLHKEYDIIMIDTPPVGLVTDGILIMRKTDLALYVVRANYSKKGVKKHINGVIRMGGFGHLAVVVNAVKSINTYGYGGYGYGYGYGYGNGYYDTKEKDSSGNWFTRLFKKS